MVNSDRAVSADILRLWVEDARARTLGLIEDLDDHQLMVPKLPTVNPMLWEMAHAVWFQERWVLQHAAGQKPLRADDERLFDSIGIAHEIRWDLPIPTREEVVRYALLVRDNVLDLLERSDLTDPLVYFVKLSVFHEDMHSEAFTYTRQTFGYPVPKFVHNVCCSDSEIPFSGDVEMPGGEFELGASANTPFVFDNEKWSHPVTVEPFAISRVAATQEDFAAFVDDEGYRRKELWTPDGWRWRERSGAEHPVYWKQAAGGEWLCRHFDVWKTLEPRVAMIHVNWYEADAYCRWANRRLPTEVEWELAATGPVEKRHYPWGEQPPSAELANLDWQAMGAVDVANHVRGDSAFGCRQMIGNVWEWTSTTFQPYPGFAVDPYKEYSRPCFGNCNVLRGGCWATRSRLIRNTWRNYYRPDRRDVLAGFRTCALR